MGNLGELRIVKAIEGNPDFNDAISTLIKSLEKEQITFFAGAGISRSSGLPVSSALIRSLVEAFCQCTVRVGIVDNEKEKILKSVLETYALERLLDSLVSVYGKNALKILNILENGAPNYSHNAIAQIAKIGLLKSIVTLNFDVLFEYALKNLQLPIKWCLPLAKVEIPPDNSSEQVTVTKPHGTLPFIDFPYKEYYLAATLRYSGDHPQKENEHTFFSIAQKFPSLLVTGYSDNDWDISPILRNASWREIFWVEHFDITKDVLPRDKPCKTIMEWLNSNEVNGNKYLIYGNIKVILKEILRNMDVESFKYGSESKLYEHEQPEFKPNNDYLYEDPLSTAYAAVKLLDGTNNELYKELLPRFETLLNSNPKHGIKISWERSMAWYNHAHKRDIRTAIKNYIPIKNNIEKNDRDSLNLLSIYQSLFYEHISALKRPYLNPYLISDYLHMRKYRNLISKTASKLLKIYREEPWQIKEINKELGITEYYMVDLYHNWAYHLVPFRIIFPRLLTKIIFKRIAKQYESLAKKFNDLDWEYRYIRRIESNLLANNKMDTQTTNEKLQQIIDMFSRTGQMGHHAYALSVLAILNSDKTAFFDAKEALVSQQKLATPSGILRMTLFQRYFWPRTISGVQTLRYLLRYSKVQ